MPSDQRFGLALGPLSFFVTCPAHDGQWPLSNNRVAKSALPNSTWSAASLNWRRVRHNRWTQTCLNMAPECLIWWWFFCFNVFPSTHPQRPTATTAKFNAECNNSKIQCRNDIEECRYEYAVCSASSKKHLNCSSSVPILDGQKHLMFEILLRIVLKCTKVTKVTKCYNWYRHLQKEINVLNPSLGSDNKPTRFAQCYHYLWRPNLEKHTNDHHRYRNSSYVL